MAGSTSTLPSLLKNFGSMNLCCPLAKLTTVACPCLRLTGGRAVHIKKHWRNTAMGSIFETQNEAQTCMGLR